MTVLTGGSITGLLAKQNEKHTVIWSTSLAGSYMTLRALSFYLGGWIPETQIADYIREIGYEEVPDEYWWYMAGVAGMTFLSALVQYRICRDMKAEEVKSAFSIPKSSIGESDANIMSQLI